MRAYSLVAILVAASVFTVALLVSGKRLVNASSKLATAQAALVNTENDVERVLQLRTAKQTIAEHRRPDQDVIARVNSALAEAGIPLERFGGLRPESDTAVPGSTHGQAIYRRQSVRVALNDLTLAQIGRFLSQWYASQPLWVPTKIDLTHFKQNSLEQGYSVTMVLTATYLSHEVKTG
jgi:hypothetical protein